MDFPGRLYFIFTQSVKGGRSETRFLALHKPVVLAYGAFRGPKWFLLQEKPGFFDFSAKATVE
jgi:hypothetical protein